MTCFVGAHLMAETASIDPGTAGQHPSPKENPSLVNASQTDATATLGAKADARQLAASEANAKPAQALAATPGAATAPRAEQQSAPNQTEAQSVGPSIIERLRAWLKPDLRQLAAMEEMPPEGPLFLIASVNIYIAAILSSFFLMLLPATYEKELSSDIKPIATLVFILIMVSAYFWMISYLTSRAPIAHPYGLVAWITLVPTVLWLGYLIYNRGVVHKVMPKAVFIFLTIIVAGSGSYFNYTYNKGGRANPWQIRFFCAAISVSCISLLSLGLSLVWYSH
jgi:hypothetical protein